MPLLRPVVLAATLACAIAAEDVGPFEHSPRIADGTANTIARDGTVESATLITGDGSVGAIALQSWSGDRQSGGSGALAGNNLRLAPGTNAYVGLTAPWSIQEGTDAAGFWQYYGKWQQDVKLCIGWFDVSSQPLPARLNLDGAHANARLVLVLPARQVQGGGASYTTGWYQGNPITAGLWYCPPNTSLIAAQATIANRLANPGSFLGEVAPDRFTTAFKLQVQPEGRWWLRADIDADGDPDLDMSSEDAGNLRNPATTMTEASGLVVSAIAAQGTPAGKVGRTSIALAYRVSGSRRSSTASIIAPYATRFPANPSRAQPRSSGRRGVPPMA